MVQKYGAEIYGTSAQMAGQRSTGTASSTGTSSGSASSLISCSVSPLMKLPIKGFVKEANVAGEDFQNALNGFKNYLQKNKKNEEWVKTHQEVDDLLKNIDQIRIANGPKDNQPFWDEIVKILGKRGSVWEQEIGQKNSALANEISSLRSAWTKFSGGTTTSPDGAFGNVSSDLGGGRGGINAKDTSWDPTLVFRIDIRTSFNDDWYKRKFKSGLLNKAIFAVKTAAMADAKRGGSQQQYAGHKYSADEELLPQEKRKLDGIQWKMTNKVAKDFISLFCGWSRKKEMFQVSEGGGFKPAQPEMTIDKAFGDQMAKNALGGRGILGRLKQKLFAGGQSNNVISVVFQMADPADGWTVVDPQDENKDAKGGEKGEGEEEEDKEKGGKPDASDAETSDVEISSGATDEDEGEEGQEKESEPIAKTVKNNKNDQLKMAAESQDCFEGVNFDSLHEEDIVYESDRYEIVKDICMGKEGRIDELVDKCLMRE